MSNNRDIVYRYGQEGLEDLQRKLLEMAGAAQTAAKQISEGGKSGSAGLKALDEAARQAKGVVDDFANRAGVAGSIIARLGPVGLGAAAGIGAITAGLTVAIREAAQAEREMVKLEAIIKAQGSTARASAAEISGYADAIAATTMAAEGDLKAAAGELLAFKGIAGSTFNDVLIAAQDLAAAGFGSLASNAVALGKALNDPLNEAKALQKVFPALTDEQVKSIAATAEQNGVFAAQQQALKNVRDLIGGTGAAEADTLIGAWKLLKQEMTEGAEDTGSWFLRDLKGAVQGATAKLRRARGSANPEDAVIIDGQLFTLSEVRKSLANTQAFLAAAERDVQVGRERGLAALKKHEEDKKAVEERVGAERVAADKKREQEKLANAQAVWEQSERAYATAVKNMQDAAEQALVREDGLKVGMLPDLVPADVQQWIDDQQRAVDRIKAIEDEATRDMFDFERDMWRDLLDGKITSFENFATAIGGIWKDRVANMIASGETDIAKIFGTGPMAGFQAGMAGYSLGNSISKPRQGPGNEIGATVGGAAGYYFGGPLGSFVGSTIGSLLGGQFGPRASDRLETVTRGLYTNQRWENDLGPNKDSPENRAAVNALDDAIMLFTNTLKNFGLNTTASSYTVAVGSGNSLAPYQASVSGGATQSFQTMDQAFAWVADQLVGSLATVPERLQTLVDEFDGTNVEAFFNEIERFANFDTTLANVSDELLKITDPKAWELKQVTDWFDGMVAEATALGYDITSAIFAPVIALRDQQIANINTRYTPTPVAPGAPPAAPVNPADDPERIARFVATVADAQDELLRIRDPKAFEIKQITDWYATVTAEALALGRDISDFTALRDEQLAGINARYAPGAPAPLAETANWLTIIGGLYDKRITQLQDEAAALRESAQAWERVGSALRMSRQGLLTDPSLSPLSLEARRGEAFSQLQAAYAAAQGGDSDAAAQLPDLARAALTASREFYRSSEDYYRDFNAVQDMLGAAESYAAQQVDIAQQALDVQMAILATLQAQRGGLGSSGRPAFNTADVSRITTEFQGAWQRSGMSRSDFLASDEGQNVWLPLREQWIGGITDETQLRASLGAARDQRSEGGYASSDAVLFEQQVTNRMRELGFDVPTMHSGGMVRRTGLVYAEQGEHITPRGGMSGIEKTVAALVGRIDAMTQVLAETGSRSLERLDDIAGTNTAMLQAENMSGLSARLSGRGKVNKGS